MDIVLLIGALSAAVLWISHRLYLAYVNAVAREERRLAMDQDGELPRHIGPRCFLLLDAFFLFGLLYSLEILAFGNEQRHQLVVAAITLTRFSALVAFWLVIERGHLERFYAKLARSRSGNNEFAESSLTDGPSWVRVHAILLGLALVPLFLEVAGLNLASAELPSAIALFGCFFVLPQLGLLALSVRRLQPMRRAIHQRV